MNNVEMYELAYYILPIIGLVITLVAQIKVKSNYKKYKKVLNTSGLKGYEVARKILDANGLSNIKVNAVSGELTDHYDPKNKVINLSTDIYNGATIASSSVAAHECGHAIQDKVGYKPMIIRSKLVPITNFSTKIGYLVIFIGLILGLFNLSIIGLILLMTMLLFQLVTLPVEYNASSRAKDELKKLNILKNEENNGANKMLHAAALTYVASLATTLLQILRIAVQILGSRRKN